ncbi:hypothetical protein LguiA_026522 [Lonicera macranthoides]
MLQRQRIPNFLRNPSQQLHLVSLADWAHNTIAHHNNSALPPFILKDRRYHPPVLVNTPFPSTC